MNTEHTNETDTELMNELQAEVVNGDWRELWNLSEDLEDDALRASVSASITLLFGLEPCPYCKGRGGFSGTQTIQGLRGCVDVDVDADCDFCQGLGLVSRAELEQDAEREHRRLGAACYPDDLPY